MKKFIFITYIILIICFIRIILYIKDSYNNRMIEKITSDIVIPSKERDFIDFKRLKSINKDTVGYLEVLGVDIKYVVVKGKNNKYYLNHNFYKEYSGTGWVFMDYRNKLDGNDKNIIIYAHNMKDNSMFGKLRNTLYKEWRSNEENLIIKLYRIDGLHLYKVFSTYIVESEEFYIKTNFNSDIDYSNFLNTIIKRSNYDYHEYLNTNYNILTLSTCYKNTTKRVVLHAYEIVN